MGKKDSSEIKNTGVAKYIKFISSNWAFFLFLIAIISSLIGWLFFDISLFQSYEEISLKQEEYRSFSEENKSKEGMVSRHLALGNSFLNVAQLEAAQIEFEKALKLDSYNEQAQMGIFKSEVFKAIDIKDGQYKPEIVKKRINQILQKNPNDPHAFLFLGDVYYSINQVKAEEYYKKALINDSTVAAAYQGLGLIYDQNKMTDDALEMFEKASELSEWNQAYLVNLGYQYKKMGQYSLAIEKYDLAHRLNSDYLCVYYCIANAYNLNKEYHWAHAFQKRLCELLSDNRITELDVNRGQWYWNTENQIVTLYDLSERKYYAYFSAGLTSYVLGNFNEADAYIKKAEGLPLSKNRQLAINLLVKHDITLLQKEHEELVELLNKFVLKYSEHLNPKFYF